MRVVIQRCEKASVTVNNDTRNIDNGLVVLLGITNGDSEKEQLPLAQDTPSNNPENSNS